MKRLVRKPRDSQTNTINKKQDRNRKQRQAARLGIQSALVGRSISAESACSSGGTALGAAAAAVAFAFALFALLGRAAGASKGFTFGSRMLTETSFGDASVWSLSANTPRLSTWCCLQCMLRQRLEQTIHLAVCVQLVRTRAVVVRRVRCRLRRLPDSEDTKCASRKFKFRGLLQDSTSQRRETTRSIDRARGAPRQASVCSAPAVSVGTNTFQPRIQRSPVN